MIKEDKQLSQMKYELEKLKKRGVKSVERILTTKQRNYVEEVLGYEAIPYLYEIKTKTFQDFSTITNSKLKEIHYSNKQGKKTIVRSLKHKDKQVLEENNIKLRPIKFKIVLTS